MSQFIIYDDPVTGICAVVIPSSSWKGTMEALAAKDVPGAAAFDIVELADIRPDRTFRNAWRKGTGVVDIDIPAAKLIAHNFRRAKKLELLKPHDDIIAKQIPGEDAVKAEVDRAAIRNTDSTVQTDIDSAIDEPSLKTILVNYGAV